MLAFARHVRNPKVYFVGRSQEAADRIVAECKEANSGGKYIFIKADVSLLANVDCKGSRGIDKFGTLNGFDLR